MDGFYLAWMPNSVAVRSSTVPASPEVGTVSKSRAATVVGAPPFISPARRRFVDARVHEFTAIASRDRQNRMQRAADDATWSTSIETTTARAVRVFSANSADIETRADAGRRRRSERQICTPADGDSWS